jgi:uridine phosphorylase
VGGHKAAVNAKLEELKAKGVEPVLRVGARGVLAVDRAGVVIGCAFIAR